MTSWKHDTRVESLRAVGRSVALEDAALAFLASLGSASASHRPALITTLLAQRIPEHAFDATRSASWCAVCGAPPADEYEDDEDDDGTTVLPGSVPQAEQFLLRWRELPRPRPTAADQAVLERLLALVSELPSSAGEAKLNEAIGKAKLFRGDKYARRFVLETLAYASVLVPPDRRGLLEGWVAFPEREERPSIHLEIDAPLAFWRAGHGYDAASVARLFPGVER